MRKALLGTAFGLLAGPALAQPPTTPQPTANDWVVIRMADGALAWNLNAGRWSQDNMIVEGERLDHYATPYEVDGKKIAWAREFWKISCAANTYQTKSGEELGTGLGTIFELSAGQPRPIKDNTPEYLLKRVYCDNATASDGQHVTGMLLDVMDMMAGGNALPKSAQ
ncbi:MAG: hypothetical protein EON61_08955 [Alphaproteobacteria bacterium]|nr:MAG: hypothetical protein EON61_08955 [Alphaproteobacteria bacterium]